MKTRPATPFDAVLLSNLCVPVQEMHAKHHPEIFVMPSKSDFAKTFFATQLEDPTVHIFIAEESEQAFGCILCRLIERPANVFAHELRFILIEQISVLPEAQGYGIGAALMQCARDLAVSLKVTHLRLETWDFNTKAHGFFEHEGFTRFNYRYWLNLEQSLNSH